MECSNNKTFRSIRYNNINSNNNINCNILKYFKCNNNDNNNKNNNKIKNKHINLNKYHSKSKDFNNIEYMKKMMQSSNIFNLNNKKLLYNKNNSNIKNVKYINNKSSIAFNIIDNKRKVSINPNVNFKPKYNYLNSYQRKQHDLFDKSTFLNSESDNFYNSNNLNKNSLRTSSHGILEKNVKSASNDYLKVLNDENLTLLERKYLNEYPSYSKEKIKKLLSNKNKLCLDSNISNINNNGDTNATAIKWKQYNSNIFYNNKNCKDINNNNNNRLFPKTTVASANISFEKVKENLKKDNIKEIFTKKVNNFINNKNNDYKKTSFIKSKNINTKKNIYTNNDDIINYSKHKKLKDQYSSINDYEYSKHSDLNKKAYNRLRAISQEPFDTVKYNYKNVKNLLKFETINSEGRNNINSIIKQQPKLINTNKLIKKANNTSVFQSDSFVSQITDKCK